VLHYYQDKSYQEIAQVLGITYDNVRKRMSQARAILREQEQLRECVGEEDVREMRWFFGLCWRVWADSGGCWLCSI
jgi:predicted DNA-binding protein YlxM (UPF0122 family)